MPYKINFNDSTYMTAPTLGDLVSAASSVVKIKIVSDYIFWAEEDGYWFSQAESNADSREIGIFRQSGNLGLYVGGGENYIGSVSTIFGSSIIDGSLQIEIDIASSTYSLEYNGSVVKSGSFSSVGSRTNNVLFRIGARSDISAAPNNTGSFILQQDEQIGDTRVYLDVGAGYVLERDYVIPSTGTTIPDDENFQDGTMRGTFSDAQLIFYSLPATTPINPSITNLLATSARLNWEQG